MVIPNEISSELVIVENMVVVDNIGKSHEITEVFEDGSFSIKQGTIADFSNSVIKGARPAYITFLESVVYKENYQIGVHVSGEPVYLTWLHSIIVFILLRYKQAMLESRGFERSIFNSSEFDQDLSFETENVFSRYISLSGFVRQYWPSAITPRINSVEIKNVKVIGGEKLPNDTDPNKVIWIGDEDTIL